MSEPSHARLLPPASAPPRPETGDATSALVPMDNLGTRLRQLRMNAGFSLRELARLAKVSPSLVSQIENGKSRPSVSTLYGFARLLDVTVDELFDAENPADPDGFVTSAKPTAPTDPANAWHPSEYANRISVLHPSHRSHLRMAEGVDWERLAATPERDINFMKITYAPGAASTVDGSPMVHEGYEYGYVLAGAVQVTVGDEEFLLRAGESLGFNSLIPHVMRNVSAEEFQGIWFVHGSSH